MNHEELEQAVRDLQEKWKAEHYDFDDPVDRRDLAWVIGPAILLALTILMIWLIPK